MKWLSLVSLALGLALSMSACNGNKNQVVCDQFGRCSTNNQILNTGVNNTCYRNTTTNQCVSSNPAIACYQDTTGNCISSTTGGINNGQCPYGYMLNSFRQCVPGNGGYQYPGQYPGGQYPYPGQYPQYPYPYPYPY